MEATPARLAVDGTAQGVGPGQEGYAGQDGLTSSLPDKGAGEAATWNAGHAVNIRLTIPFVFGRYYLTVVAGKERRSPDRLAVERRKHPLATFGNLAFFFTLGSIGGLALLALMQFLSALVLQEMGMVVTMS